MRSARSSDLVCEGAHTSKRISDMTMLLRRTHRADVKMPGFRSTFRDWTAEQTSYPNHVAEMALAHRIGDKVEAAYRRGELLAKRRELMTDWASYSTS